MKAMKDIWNEALKTLQSEVTAVSFDLWITTLEPIDLAEGVLYLSATSETAKARVLKLHEGQIMQALLIADPEIKKFVVLDPNERDQYFAKREEKQAKAEYSAPIFRFDQKYTFDSFVVGNSNKYVYAACRGVAENPFTKINPLFIYGGVGLGKTHLLHAIGNYLNKQRPELKVLYVTCNKFVNDYIECMASRDTIGAVTSFRAKYASVDVLMVDDIQFISNKTGTQEEFFHTFNDMFQNNKQIIITSDRPPKEIATLEDRLVSRFSMGIMQDIQSPDYETRFAILQKKAQQENFDVEEEVINHLAEVCDTNVREMEGILSKIIFYAQLAGKNKATMEEVSEALKDVPNTTKQDITTDRILEQVCKYFSLRKEDLVGKKKNKEIVEPRQIAMYLICELLDLPLTSIGQVFGGRDHTTVIHAREKITNEMKENKRMKVMVSDIKNIIERK